MVWLRLSSCCAKGPCNVARIPKPRGPADGWWTEGDGQKIGCDAMAQSFKLLIQAWLNGCCISTCEVAELAAFFDCKVTRGEKDVSSQGQLHRITGAFTVRVREAHVTSLGCNAQFFDSAQSQISNAPLQLQALHSIVAGESKCALCFHVVWQMDHQGKKGGVVPRPTKPGLGMWGSAFSL